jgi:predicted Ser/Thr protein kinase
MTLISDHDLWIETKIGDYKLRSKLGQGKIGVVFLGEHISIPSLRRAYKIIAEGQLKTGWEREIAKVSQLNGVTEVAPVLDFGAVMDGRQRPCSFIAYDYVDGKNLREFIDEEPEKVTVSFVIALLQALLRVHFACSQVGFEHGDLHEGNVLISEPDKRDPDQKRRVVITDFGYGGSHNALEPKDDIAQIASIGIRLLKDIRRDTLESSERVIRERLLAFLSKDLNDSYRRAGASMPGAAPALLLGVRQTVVHDLDRCIAEAKREAGSAGKVVQTSVDDYLNAEQLGYRREEWQRLFVPALVGEPAFVGRNVTVITGARGCGKTMAFRRLTLHLDELIGENSGVKGSDEYFGFYMNCRDIAEVFPYVPRKVPDIKARQIIHFFHLCWLQDVVRGLQQRALRQPSDHGWLVAWFESVFDMKIDSLWSGSKDSLVMLAHFVEQQKDSCVRSIPGKRERWALEDVDLLDRLYTVCGKNLEWIQGRPFYFYFDDYTIPLVSQHIQAILNPIVFKRRPNLFFKVSTEAGNSFLRLVHQKPLEINHDFDFVDLASTTHAVDEETKEKLLNEILSRRLIGAAALGGSEASLVAVLGESEWKSFNELARKLRERKLKSSDPLYFGQKAFVGMWSSDLRSMIQLFNELLRASLAGGQYVLPIEKTIQHKKYSEAGGEFLSVTENLRVGGFWDDDPKAGQLPKDLGTVLRNVAQAFIAISRFELIEGQLIDNQGALNPRQALRVEILDEFELSDRARKIYQALLRWHVFLPDWRGRSVRGFMVPRLFLNRRLVPYARLSFSGKDSISLRSEEFGRLLLDPLHFENYWRGKSKKRKLAAQDRNHDQLRLLDDET